MENGEWRGWEPALRRVSTFDGDPSTINHENMLLLLGDARIVRWPRVEEEDDDEEEENDDDETGESWLRLW